MQANIRNMYVYYFDLSYITVRTQYLLVKDFGNTVYVYVCRTIRYKKDPVHKTCVTNKKNVG